MPGPGALVEEAERDLPVAGAPLDRVDDVACAVKSDRGAVQCRDAPDDRQGGGARGSLKAMGRRSQYCKNTESGKRFNK